MSQPALWDKITNRAPLRSLGYPDVLLPTPHDETLGLVMTQSAHWVIWSNDDLSRVVGGYQLKRNLTEGSRSESVCEQSAVSFGSPDTEALFDGFSSSA